MAPKATSLRARLTVETVARFVNACTITKGDHLEQVGLCGFVDGRSSDGAKEIRYRRWAVEVLQILKQNNPLIIHAFTPLGVLPALVYKLINPKTRVIFEMHGLNLYELANGPALHRIVLGILDILGCHGSDAVIVMSFTQRDMVTRLFGVPKQKQHVIWAPVDLQLFRYSDPPPPSPFTVGYAGNDRPYQGLDTLLNAASLLESERDLVFLIMGVSPETYAHLSLPDNVIFEPDVRREEMSERLSRCHVLVSPRLGGAVTEAQFPFKLSAYLATGRPVIATAVNDQPRIVEEAGCGIVVPAGSAEALARAIVEVKEMSAEMRHALGVRARDFAERHLSLTRFSQRLLDLYDSLG